MKPSSPKFDILLVMLVAGALPVLLSVAASSWFGKTPYVQNSLHEWFELTGTCIALGVAMLLMLRASHQPVGPHLLWVAAALTVMGLTDGMHSLSQFGVAWSWLRHGATFMGGLLFAMVWLPLPPGLVRRSHLFLLAAGVLGVAGSLAIWRWSGWMPAPFLPGGYSVWVKAANVLGGMGFLTAFGFFARRYVREPQVEDLVFAGHTLLFGMASLLFGFSHVWDPAWWVWHGVRLMAYAVVLVAAYDTVVALYRQTARQAQELEERVVARTAELAASERRYRSFIEVTSQFAWVTEPAGRVVEDIPALRAFTGQTYEQARDAGWAAALHPDDVQRTLEVWNRAVSTRTAYETEYRMRRHDGTYRLLLARGVPILDDRGSVMEWVGTCIDITERKRAEAALKKAHDELEVRIRERTAELVRVNEKLEAEIAERKQAEARMIGNNAILNGINQIFQETLSCESEEKLCRKCLEIAEAQAGSRFGIIAELNPAGRLDTIALSDPGWSACRMAKTDAFLSLKDLPVRGMFGGIIREGKSVIINDPETAPERTGTPEGHPPITSLLGVPLKQAGKTIGLIALANKDGGYDISDREAAEVLAMAIVEALMRLRAEIGVRRMNMELEQRVHERTAELESANRELEAFAYSVSHDLRAPLRSINGFSRVLEEDYGARLDAEGKDSLNRIVAATNRMGQLIDDLLKLSCITRAEMKRKRVNLSEHARVIAGRLKEAQPERRVEFIIAEDMAVDGDERLLAVVLENLIGNAWKFTEKTPLAVIEFGVVRHDDKTAYFVRDNGTGFDMVYAGKLFNPFERLHSIEQFPGTGIGLATVKRIVNRHGGRVWAEGAMGKGATIYFTI